MHYPKAPIQEAVMQFQFGSTASDDILKKISNATVEKYPSETPQAHIDVQVDTTGGQVHMQQTPVGYQRRSTDQADVVLIAPNSIAATRIAPYEKWENLKACMNDASKLWYRYSGISNLTRIGVRYINRLDIPLNEHSVVLLQEYLTLRPNLPECCSKNLESYVIQSEGPTTTPNWSVRLTSAKVPPPTLDYVSIILDIDLFRVEKLPKNERDALDMLDEARQVKNEIFESCITDKSRDLFR